MKKKLALAVLLAMCFFGVQAAWGQWSSDASKNLPLADRLNNDQVQPKVRPLPNDQWYVSWFDADPNSPPPVGYDVYVQRLSRRGVERFRHDGLLVADLSNSSTEDYGLDADSEGNALLAFLDTREDPSNQQITAAKMSPRGDPLWGHRGVQLTSGSSFHAAPKIAGTCDGGAVVAWTSDSTVVLQKLNRHGQPLWGKGVVFSESGYNYSLADLHTADDGSVIVSMVRDSGFFSDRQLRANKLSASGKRLWGKNNVVLFDTGSLQFGAFPYFIPDGSGGAVFAWYTSRPALQCFAQHIRADGSEAFPHNGAAGSTDLSDVRVEPSVSYRAKTDQTFLFWTEEDSNQFYNGVYGQKFDGQGNSQWSPTGLVIVPLGPMNVTQTFVKTVQVGSGSLVLWVDSPGYGMDTIQATRLNGKGKVVCPQFVVSSAPANKYGLSVAKTHSGLTAVAWTDDRIGNNSIYIQNVNSDCSLGRDEGDGDDD